MVLLVGINKGIFCLRKIFVLINHLD